jgi:hypothetical protein
MLYKLYLMRKTIIVLVALAIISLTNTDSVDESYSYDDFMRQFERTYEGD